MVWTVPLIILVFLAVWGYVSSSIIVTTTRAPLDLDPKYFGLDFDSFKTFTEDRVEIKGWFVRSKAKTKTAIVVLHGWGANRADVLPSTLFLAEKYHLAYFDFRNHGESGGKMTSLTCLEVKDFSAVISYVLKEKKEFVEKLGVFGFSMGGSVAISGSAQIPEIRAVVAESPFASYKETIIRFAQIFYGSPRMLVPLTLGFARLRLGFNPELCSPVRHIAKIAPRPVFILQAGNDYRMPVSEGQSLYAAAQEPKELWVVPKADHGDIQEIVGEEYRARILGFFEKWL